MTWTISYTPKAEKDLKRLDPYNRRLILKAIEKVSKRPLPPPLGIGKPLGNHSQTHLNGYYKIKLKDLGYRIVYQLDLECQTMTIIVISTRDHDDCYLEAERRTSNSLHISEDSLDYNFDYNN